MKRSRTDILWMILPVLLLAGIGWMFRNRGAATVTVPNRSIPFHLVVKGTRFVPVTAREYYDGYDTKLEVILDGEGTKPKWWDVEANGYTADPSGGLFAGTKKRALQQVPFRQNPRRNDGVWHAYYFFKRADLPANLGTIRLRDRLSVLNNTSKPKTPPVWIDVVVRKAGEVITPPQINRQSELKILKQEVTAGIPNENTYPTRDAATIRLWVQHPLNSGFGQGRVKIIGPNGKVLWDRHQHSNSQAVHLGKDTKDIYVWETTLDLIDLKRSPGELKAVCVLFNGDEWPLEVTVPLRRADGTVRSTPRGEPKFKIKSVQVRQPRTDEVATYKSTTVVEVRVVPQENIALQDKALPWPYEPSWDEMVLADTGEGYLQDVSGNNTDIDVQTVEEWEQNKLTLVFNYQLNLTRVKLASSRLVFHGSVALGGSRRVPFKIVVREAISRPKPQMMGPKLPA